MSECDESSVSSLSDISSTTSKRSKANESRHHRNQCLLCCRSNIPALSPSLKDFSILINAQKSDSIEVDTTNTTIIMNSTPQRRKNGRASIYAIDNAFNSPDSLLHEDNSNEKITNAILTHVQRMANPIWSKQSRIALFKLKQVHPRAFQDICIYSEVCKALSRNSYRLNARRFLQELYIELDDNVFRNEALEIIRSKESDISACDISLELEPMPTTPVAINSSLIEKNRTQSKTPIEVRNLPSAASSSSSTSSSSSSLSTPTIPYSIKTHLLKSPPLASVYETSRENLSESFGNSSKIMNSTTITNNISINECSIDQPDGIMTSTPSKVIVEINRPSLPNDYCTNDRRMYSRPRFNTLELDLSCTKNKFPITDRRKNYDSVTSIISNSALYSQRITKSLSASITTPTNVLFCEKRLSTSKSEAILSNNLSSSPCTFQK